MLIYVHESGDNLSPGQGQGGCKGERFPGAESLWGTESPNNVTRTAFNTVHLLPKNLICEHEGGKLSSCPWRHLNRLIQYVQLRPKLSGPEMGSTSGDYRIILAFPAVIFTRK